MEILEFDKRYEERRKREQEERDRRMEDARRPEKMWELTRLCKLFIKENSPHWESNKELRDLEIARQERLERAAKKRALLQISVKDKKEIVQTRPGSRWSTAAGSRIGTTT